MTLRVRFSRNFSVARILLIRAPSRAVQHIPGRHTGFSAFEQTQHQARNQGDDQDNGYEGCDHGRDCTPGIPAFDYSLDCRRQGLGDFAGDVLLHP